MSLDPKDEFNWKPLLKDIDRITGFKTDHYTEKFLKRRIATRLFALGLETYSDYKKQLNEKPEEKELLLKELTIHVTNFFRNKETFDIFFAETLMELLKDKKEKNNRSLKIWSAGCSTGEEPLTIAILILELLQMRVADFDIKILATDISQQTIEKAKEGVYEEIQFKEAPQEYIDKYFRKENDLYFIKDEVKKMITFEVGDILSDKMPSGLDIIFCRNTVIYFTKDLKEKLYDNFYESINDGGFFVMGMTESLSGPAKEKFKSFNNAYRIYKK